MSPREERILMENIFPERLDPAVRRFNGVELKWEESYVIDGSILCVFHDVMKRLYNDCEGLTGDEMRHLASRMEAVLDNGFSLYVAKEDS